MTTPINTIKPSKSKTWIAAIGGLLTVLVPMLLSVSTSLPEPWPAIVGAVVAILTATGVYKAPYQPEGTTVVPTAELEQIATPLPPSNEPTVTNPVRTTPGLGGYTNPFRRR